MRKLTAGLFHSIDGVVESPDQWQFDAFDDELGAIFGKFLAATDTVLLGRKGYEEWAQYWPNAEADQDFAGWINKAPKFVASRTLTQDHLTWQNSTLITGELSPFVRDLKSRDGSEIAVMGGFSLTRQLLFAGLPRQPHADHPPGGRRRRPPAPLRTGRPDDAPGAAGLHAHQQGQCGGDVWGEAGVRAG